MFLYTELCIQLSKVPGAPFNALAMSLEENNLLMFVFNKPKPFKSPTFSTSNIRLASAIALSLNNQPSSKPILANLSKVCLFTDWVIAWDVVCSTDDFKLFSSPNNFLIASGNSSPVLINLSDLKVSLDMFCNILKGSTPSCFVWTNILLVKLSAISCKAWLSVIFPVFNSLIADSLISLFFLTTFSNIHLDAAAFNLGSAIYSGLVNVAKDFLIYPFILFNIKFLRSPSGNKLANVFLVFNNSLFNNSAVSCSSFGKSLFLVCPFKKAKTLSK